MTLPSFTVDLIKELDRLYPNQCPDLTLTDREVWYRSGQRSVINRLLYLQSMSELEDGLPSVLS